MTITAERLYKLFHYEPETGMFLRLVQTSNGIKIGDAVGSANGKGYLTIHIDGKNYRAHRLAFLYMTKAWPTKEVDHINTDGADNRWSNLREATRSQNAANMRTPITNTSGFKGVYRSKKSCKWCSGIKVRTANIYLGSFDTPELAHAAYVTAAMKYHGEFARAT